MYESFFQLRVRPFLSAPAVDRYFPAPSVAAARSALARCVDRDEGVGLLIGAAGTGKTLLCRLLAEQFQDTFEVALLTSGRLATTRALLQTILYELELPYQGLDEGELRLALIDHLTRGARSPRGMLLIIDEAHLLPVKLLQESRLITNIYRNGQPRVRLVLAGDPRLEEHLANPKLEAFSQRLAARAYLEPFDRQGTIGFVRYQLEKSGSQRVIFTDEALARVHQATEGVPRLINQLCDHVLVLAFCAQLATIDAQCVEEAWTDLQQLPAPWNDSRHSRSSEIAEVSGGIVEFGVLADSPGETQHVTPAVPEPVASQPDPSTAATSRLESITADVDSLEDEFTPAGAIVPEVEFVFNEPKADWSGTFVEEEAVVDRYSPRNTGSPPRTVVNSSEGAELSAILHAVTELSGRRPVLSHAGETLEPGTVPLRGSHIGRHSTAEGFASPRRADVDELKLSEDEIVIEDDIEREAEPPPKARHKEFRQLFSKLRHG